MKKFILVLLLLIVNYAWNIEYCIAQVWSPLGSGFTGWVNTGGGPYIYALTVFNNELIAGGDFTSAGGNYAKCVAKWNGTSWSPLGNGLNSEVNALIVYNNELIAGGCFTSSGESVVKWNGTGWSNIGTTSPNIEVLALAIYNNELIAAGGFVNIDGVQAGRIAKWNGISWSPLGSGVTGGPMSGAYISALTVYNNELIVGGAFTFAGGVSANYIAKWNGTSWSPLDNGISYAGYYTRVYSLSVYNNELIAGGWFDTVGGVGTRRIAKWNGSSWSPLGNGMNDAVLSLKVFNNELIAGGFFTTAGGVNTNYVAKWNGTNWAPLGSGMYVDSMNGSKVSSFTMYNNNLIAGGHFNYAGGILSNSIAKWGPGVGIKQISQNIPDKFYLYQNYPNPFNPNTTIRFQFKETGFVTLKVYNILGNEIATLVNEKHSPGTYEVSFDGSLLGSGVYYYSLIAGDFKETKRMVLVK